MQSFILPISTIIGVIGVWIVTSLLTAKRNAAVSFERRESLISRTYDAMTAVGDRRVVDRRRKKENEWTAMLDRDVRREPCALDERSRQPN